MLDELQKGSLHNAAEIFSGLKNHAAIGSVMSGLTDSKVFVDNRDAPGCALTWTKSRIYLSGELGGEEVQRAAETIGEKIKRESIGRGAKHFIIYPDTKTPLKGMFRLLDGVKAHSGTRNYYELDARAREWGAASLDGFRLEAIDRRFLKSPYCNLDKVREEMCSERASVEEFLEKSLGICGVTEDEVASWCMSEYNHGDRYEIGIATVEKHRRKGLATATGDALMKLCLGRGFSRVGWHCWQRNTPSNRTASKLGFRLVESYPVYVLEVEG